MPVPANPYPMPGPAPRVEFGSLADTYPLTGLASLLQGVTHGVELGQKLGLTREEMDLRREQLKNEAEWRQGLLKERQSYYDARADEQRAAAAKIRAGGGSKTYGPVATAWAKSPQGLSLQAYDMQHGSDFYARNLSNLDKGGKLDLPPDLVAPPAAAPPQSNAGGMLDMIKSAASRMFSPSQPAVPAALQPGAAPQQKSVDWTHFNK